MADILGVLKMVDIMKLQHEMALHHLFNEVCELKAILIDLKETIEDATKNEPSYDYEFCVGDTVHFMCGETGLYVFDKVIDLDNDGYILAKGGHCNKNNAFNSRGALALYCLERIY